MTTCPNLKQRITKTLDESFKLVGVAATLDLLADSAEKLALEYKAKGDTLKAASAKSLAEKLKALKVF